MNEDLIELNEVVLDNRAKNGEWCTLFYPNHEKGCPNFPKCINEQPYVQFEHYKWYAVKEEFDLKRHAENMKLLHPKWTERQCRNLLYWQNGVRTMLKRKSYRLALFHSMDIVLEIPEANGVNVFATMAKVGIVLQRNPDIVKKTMLVGKML